jgi:hypothetical protein
LFGHFALIDAVYYFRKNEGFFIKTAVSLTADRKEAQLKMEITEPIQQIVEFNGME